MATLEPPRGLLMTVLRAWIALGVFLGSFSVTNAAFAYEPWCGLSYRAESYSFGVASALYENPKLVPSLMDQMCFQLGLKVGTQLKEEFTGGERTTCKKAFETSKKLGLQNEPYIMQTPSQCSNEGYPFGQAVLSTSARNGEVRVVGDHCVSAYQRGRSDGCNHIAPTLTLDNKENYCYQTGQVDGSFFQMCD